MTQTIYGDVLFLIDFSMDFLSLYVCGRICACRMRLFRLCAAASTGALFSVAVLFVPISAAPRFLLAALFAVTMCAAAFGKRRVIRNSAVFCFISFAISGSVTALLSLFGKLDPGYDVLIYGNARSLRADVPVILLFVFAAVSAIFALILGSVFRRQSSKRTALIRCGFGDKQIEFEGLVDSGDLLREPMSGSPCLIVKAERLEGVLPEGIFSYIKGGLCGKAPENISGLRAVPVNTAGGSGVLFAVRPDLLDVDGTGRRAYIALDMTDGDFGGYGALVPNEVL